MPASKSGLHKHHKVPKHVGGTDDPSNIEWLTVEEHAEAHRLLYEKYGRWQDKCAWYALSGRIGKEEIIRLKLVETARSQRGKKRGPYSEERCKNISNALKGKFKGIARGTQTETTRAKKREAAKRQHAEGRAARLERSEKGTFVSKKIDEGR